MPQDTGIPYKCRFAMMGEAVFSSDAMTQLDSTEAVRYVWYGWHFIGIHPFATHKNLYMVYSVFVTVCVTFFSPVQLILGAFFVESFGHLMRNMSTSIELICCSLKTAVVFALRSKILESHNYLRELDKRADANPEDRRRMDGIIVNCKRIFIIYKILFWLTLGFYAIVGALTGKLVFDGWLPFDWKSSRKRYIIAFSYQWLNSCYQCIMNLTTDVYSVLYAYVMLGHLKCIARRISNIGYDNGAKTTQENYQTLIQCINDHRNALSFFECLTPVISGTIFVQFLLTAFVLCMTAICVLLFKDDLTFLATTFCYLIAVTGEVLPCCYLVNEIMSISDKLTTSIYCCNWMDQDERFRKAVIIFMQRSQKPIVIMAGNLIPISLATFMSLIRISFSLFTLLTSM